MSHGQEARSARIEVLELMQRARSGALATLLDGGPYVSLVNVAPDENGEPVLLLSRLAWHTRNIEADRRGCLLLTDNSPGIDLLEGSRVSLVGSLARDAQPTLRSLYLSYHPQAARYADFGDFGFYRLTVALAHFVAGFGRIVTLDRQELLGVGTPPPPEGRA